MFYLQGLALLGGCVGGWVVRLVVVGFKMQNVSIRSPVTKRKHKAQIETNYMPCQTVTQIRNTS